MKRLIFVPQYPVYMRYQEWWLIEFEKKFQEYYDVIILGKSVLNYFNSTNIRGKFAPIDISIRFESAQIQEFLDLKLEDSDVLFLSDISFPGFFSNILHHKKIKNAYAFCHGTSKNAYDYFQDNRDSKRLVESGHSKLFKKVFVATNYHKQKLGWKNTKVIGVPQSPFETFKLKKEYNLISVCRDSIQKRNKYTEKKIIKSFGELIYKNDFNTWKDYYKFLSKSRILLITSKEDTFNYSILEAVKNGCIPICPNKFSFPELLERKFLYDNLSELEDRINYVLNNNLFIEELKNSDLIENFFDNLVKEMI